MATSEEILTKLNAEQEALLSEVRTVWLNAVHTPLDVEKAKEGIKWMYSLIGKKPPIVIVLQNPYELQVAANLLKGTTNEFYPFSESVMYDSHWVAYYDYFSRPEVGLTITKTVRENLTALIDYLTSGVSLSVLFEGVTLICGPPTTIRRDETGRTSAVGVPAIEWPGWGGDVWKMGDVRLVNERYHCHPSEWKAEWLIDEPNTEVKRLILEQLSPDTVFAELGAVLIDSWREYELFEVTKADIGVRLLRMKSPPLKDDSTPEYIGTVPESIQTAEEGIVWRNRGHHPDEFAWVA